LDFGHPATKKRQQTNKRDTNKLPMFQKGEPASIRTASSSAYDLEEHVRNYATDEAQLRGGFGQLPITKPRSDRLSWNNKYRMER
jgi:hypothetical protein